MSKRATINDVATLAGVSIATVSRVLAGNYPTTAGVRAKVFRAAEELDYAPNAHARSLAGSDSKIIGVILMDVSSPFYAKVARGVERQAAGTGRLSLVCQTGLDPDRELALVQHMREQRAELVVLVGGVVENGAYRARIARYAQALNATGSRLVLCGRPAPDDDLPALVVEYDNEEGAYAITSHVLARGHRDIVYLGFIPGHSTSEQRVAGFRRAMADYGLPEQAMRVLNRGPRRPGAGSTRDRSIQETHDLLDSCSGTPDFTAVVASDDEAAAGVIRALTDRGIAVPDEVSVVGYNDDSFAADLCPPLTTVHIPAEELGRTAVRMATGDDGTRHGALHQERRVLGTHIVVRNSVAQRALPD